MSALSLEPSPNSNSNRTMPRVLPMIMRNRFLLAAFLMIGLILIFFFETSNPR